MFDHERDDLDMVHTVERRRHEISRKQMQEFEGYMAEIFETLGMDLNTPAIEETPRRSVLSCT